MSQIDKDVAGEPAGQPAELLCDPAWIRTDIPPIIAECCDYLDGYGMVPPKRLSPVSVACADLLPCRLQVMMMKEYSE